MLRPGRFILCLILPLIGGSGTGFSQQSLPKRPPTIIRDTGVAEGKTDAETAVKKEYNPALAEENLKVGSFYLKRGNIDAAIQRYREALDYNPKLVEAFDALGRAYEKKGDKAKALEVYRDFVKQNPDSPKAADFKSRGDRLEKELSKK
jgi:tetratricopeptide (TPR) repeat protein